MEKNVELDSFLPVEKRIKFSEKLLFGKLGLNSQIFLQDDNIFELNERNPGYLAKYDISGTSFSIFVLPIKSEKADILREKLSVVFEGRFKKSDEIDGIKVYEDNRGRFYTSTYLKNRFVLLWRVSKKGDIIPALNLLK